MSDAHGNKERVLRITDTHVGNAERQMPQHRPTLPRLSLTFTCFSTHIRRSFL